MDSEWESPEPPDPINHVCSIQVNRFQKKHFTYPSLQIFKIIIRDFFLQNLILRTILCGTA